MTSDDLGWRNKEKKDVPVFRAPPGYRDSGGQLFKTGEVLSSTYQIRKLLHSDDTGQVYEAWDMLIERVVAIKGAWRDDDVPVLVPVARASSSIPSPCVAAVYGIGHHHGSEYLAAERIVGKTLAQRIDEVYQDGNSMPALAVIELLGQLARGLEAVHSTGYTIGRLSTGNTIITANKRLVFAHFALGQGQIEGKSPIFAPEVIVSGRLPEPGTPAAIAVDLYALGCIAVELCTAAAPFSGDSLKALKFAHVHHRPPQLSMLREDVPTELGDMVEELLAKSPEDRPPSAGDVAAQLRAIAERTSASRRVVRVVIVDDDPQRVRPLWSILRRAHSCTIVDAAVTAEEGAKKLRTDQPDVLIVNLELPGNMNGLELCMYFCGIQERKNCSIVALGHSLKEEDVTILRQIGVAHVLPYSSRSHRQLIAIIRDLA